MPWCLYDLGNTRPGQVSLYTRVCITRVCIERKRNDAGGWFWSSPGYNCCLRYCCPISIEERRKRFCLSIYLHCSLCAYRLQPKGLIDSLYLCGSINLTIYPMTKMMQHSASANNSDLISNPRSPRINRDQKRLLVLPIRNCQKQR